MFVLLFAYVFGGAIGVEGGSYREYLVGGILIQTLGFGLVGPAMSIATDRTEGVLDRFRSLPVRRTSYLMGHFLAEVGGMVLATVLLLTAGLVVGWRTHTGVGELALSAVLILAFASAMVWLGTYVGLLVRAPDTVMGVAFTSIFPLTFVSNAFVPIDSLPNVLQWVASFNPVSVLVSAVRELWGNPVAVAEGRVADTAPRGGGVPVRRGDRGSGRPGGDPPVPSAHAGLTRRLGGGRRYDGSELP